MSYVVDAESFGLVMKDKLGDKYHRASALLEQYGSRLSFDFTNALMQAADQGPEKIEAVLVKLEQHYTRDLQTQHPDIRGYVGGWRGDLTKRVFDHIYQDILSLKPSS